MNIVIWGAGVRGRRLIRFLGRERVAAFIDNRAEIQDTFYDGVPIVSFEKYLNSYLDYYVVVTPILGKERILDELRGANVARFMLLSDCPDNFYDYDYEVLMGKVLRSVNEGDVVLYGINIYALLVARYLSRHNIKVTILPKFDDNNEIIRKDLESRGYAIDSMDSGKLRANISHVWLTNEISREDAIYIKQNGLKSRRLYDFSDIMPYGTNPGLKKFKDKHKGKRCFVVATGPSLRMEDLDRLASANEICISMNGIYHAFDKTEWRPNYFVVSDKAAHLLAEHIDSIDVKYKFVSDQSDEYWSEKHPDNVYKFHTRFCEKDLKFSDDFSLGTYTGGTVTYNCIQLAYYLGCNPIYLLGTDCNFEGYNKGVNAHFTSDYVFDKSLRKGKETPLTNAYTENEQYLAQMRTYKAAKQFADNNDLQIINATRGGKLEVFERVDFDNLF